MGVLFCKEVTCHWVDTSALFGGVTVRKMSTWKRAQLSLTDVCGLTVKHCSCHTFEFLCLHHVVWKLECHPSTSLGRDVIFWVQPDSFLLPNILYGNGTNGKETSWRSNFTLSYVRLLGFSVWLQIYSVTLSRWCSNHGIQEWCFRSTFD